MRTGGGIILGLLGSGYVFRVDGCDAFTAAFVFLWKFAGLEGADWKPEGVPARPGARTPYSKLEYNTTKHTSNAIRRTSSVMRRRAIFSSNIMTATMTISSGCCCSYRGR